MPKTVKARYTKGTIELLEKLDIAEGTEILVTVAEISSGPKDGLERSAGAWKGTIDAEKLINAIYADRLVSTRREPKL